MPKRIEVLLVVPSGYPAYMNWDDAADAVVGWVERVRAWFVAEAGYTFDYNFRLHRSSYSIYDFSDGGAELDGCPYAPIPEGLGMSWDRLRDILWSEARLTNIGSRIFVVVIGAGGYAGGAYEVTYNHGFAAVGDWRLRYEVTGDLDPCCMWKWPGGESFCAEDPAGSFGHEILHAMGVDPHNPLVSCGDPLTSGQIAALIARNSDFLYPRLVKCDQPGTIISYIAAAFRYLNQLYFNIARVDSALVHWGAVGESPAFPLWIWNSSLPEGQQLRMFGHYDGLTGMPYTKIYSNWYTEREDSMVVGFEDRATRREDADYSNPRVEAHRRYNEDGSVTYTVRGLGGTYYGTDEVGLYLGGERLCYMGDWYGRNFNDFSASVTRSYLNAFRSLRYTIRHGNWLNAFVYDAVRASNMRDALKYMARSYGFFKDIYMPLVDERARTFRDEIELTDDFMFTADCYKDCEIIAAGSGDQIGLPHDAWYYPYESKVARSPAGYAGCLGYIMASSLSIGARMLQALHIINKYQDIDHPYVDPTYGRIPGFPLRTITPVIIAEEMEAVWDRTGGIGLPSEFSPSKMSAYRTDLFLALESVIGYGSGRLRSKQYADAAANVVMDTIWGMDPYGTHMGEVYTGTLFRPNHTGGQLGCWELGSHSYRTPAPTFFDNIVDRVNMPPEDAPPVPTNQESTATAFLALRIYLAFRHGVFYGSKNGLMLLEGYTSGQVYRQGAERHTGISVAVAPYVPGVFDETINPSMISALPWGERRYICTSLGYEPECFIEAETGIDGDFSIHGLEPGNYIAYAFRPGFLWTYKRFSVPSRTCNVRLPSVTLLAGDVNVDGQVNMTDFGLLARSYLKTRVQVGYDSRCDFNNSGQVNIADFGLLALNYLHRAPTSWPGEPTIVDLGPVGTAGIVKADTQARPQYPGYQVLLGR